MLILRTKYLQTYDNVKVVEKGKYRLFHKDVIEVEKDHYLLLNKEEQKDQLKCLTYPT